MKLRDVLEDRELHMDVVVGEERALERPLRSVMVTDLPDPRRYLTGGELVLTGMVWRRGAADSTAFVDALVESEVAGLAAGDQYHSIPDDLIEACRAAGLPLLRVPADVAFATITERINRALTPQRADDLAELLGQHRHLVDAESGGREWLTEVLELVRRHLDLGCAVLSPAGHVIASAGLELSGAARAELAREYLAGRHLPATVSGRTLYGITDAFAPRVVGWFLVFGGDCAGWAADQHRLAGELAALIATGCRRMSHARQGHQPLADEIVRLLTAVTDPAELQPRLELAGLPADSALFVVVARLSEGAAGLARGILEELLDVAVAVLDGEAVAMVPAGGQRATEIVRALREDTATLADGFSAARLLVGVSGVVAGASELRGALDEARYACRLSELRDERVAFTEHEDLSSHMMLLAAVPEDVRRSFRRRVLGPVLDYDQANGAALVPTLRAFLVSSGSWTKCAGALHLHVNTLRYRIQRIEQLTGRDLGKIDDRVDFFLALSLD
ncbi:MAG: PucR family transcriptional regulator [Pseudonocardiaceae bacterium]|nr:PucR family transcriptional regulator [Pseudonocardiaceae bacterium]